MPAPHSLQVPVPCCIPEAIPKALTEAVTDCIPSARPHITTNPVFVSEPTQETMAGSDLLLATMKSHCSPVASLLQSPVVSLLRAPGAPLHHSPVSFLCQSPVASLRRSPEAATHQHVRTTLQPKALSVVAGVQPPPRGATGPGPPPRRGAKTHCRDAPSRDARASNLTQKTIL